MNENEQMLELERKISCASNQIFVLAEHLLYDYEMPMNAQHLAVVIKEKAGFIKEGSPKLSHYLEFDTVSAAKSPETL